MKTSRIVVVLVVIFLLTFTACGKKTGLDTSSSHSAADTASVNDTKHDITTEPGSDPTPSPSTPVVQIGTAQTPTPAPTPTQTPTPTQHVHVSVTDAEVVATCQHTGLSEGSHCAECGQILVKQEVLPIIGHHYENGVCIWCGMSDPSVATSSNTNDTGDNIGFGGPNELPII